MNPTPTDTAELLDYVELLGVVLRVDGDDLRYRAPTGVLSEEIKTMLRERKPQIIACLNECREALSTPNIVLLDGAPDSHPVFCVHAVDGGRLLCGLGRRVGGNRGRIRDSRLRPGSQARTRLEFWRDMTCCDVHATTLRGDHPAAITRPGVGVVARCVEDVLTAIRRC